MMVLHGRPTQRGDMPMAVARAAMLAAGNGPT